MFKKKKKVNVFEKLEPKVTIEKHQNTHTVDGVPTVGEPTYEIKLHTVKGIVGEERLELSVHLHLTQPEMRALFKAIDAKYPLFIEDKGSTLNVRIKRNGFELDEVFLRTFS